MMFRLILIAFISTMAGIGLTGIAAAETAYENCQDYISSTQGNPKYVAVVPDSMLTQNAHTINCLSAVIKTLAATINSALPDQAATAEATLLSATAALRKMIQNAMAQDGKNTDQPNLKAYNKLFRDTDDLVVTSVLSYGARSKNKDLRLNSVWILTNIIDNTTVCVPLSHLNDSALKDAVTNNDTTAIIARTNLLSVITIVAPWANKENFDSIQNTNAATRKTFTSGDPNFVKTELIINNISARLGSLTDPGNKREPMPDQWRQDCKAFVESFVPKLDPAIVNLNLQY